MKSNINSIRIIHVIVALFLISCQPHPDYEALKKEILALHQTTITAHLTKNVDFFVQNLSDDYWSVSNGEIRQPSKEKIRQNFESYLNNTTFSEYRDLEEPLIGFSKDGSLAWSIVRVKVAGQRWLDEGKTRELDFICAWITLYQRESDKWTRLGEVSNFQ